MNSTRDAPLDELDMAILSHLEGDGRKSFSDIATELDVTVSTVSTRANRLINDKVVTILGFLNPLRAGMIVSATLFITCQPGHIEPVAQLLTVFPEISYLALFTGDFDLFVEVSCRDFVHLSELLTERIHPIRGIEKVRSSFHLRRLKLKQPSLSLLVSNDHSE